MILGTLSMGYGKAVTALGQLLLVPILANAWGMELYGQWLMLATIPVFLGASDLGFGSAAGNRLIGEVAQRDLNAAQRTFASALVVTLGCSAAIAAMASALSLFMPAAVLTARGGLDGNGAREVLLVLIAYGAIALQGGLFMAVMRAEGAFARSTSVEATVQLAEVAAVASAALKGGGPLAAALALLGTRGVGIGCHILLACRHAGWLKLRLGAACRQTIRSLLRPALAAMLLPLAMAGLLQGASLAIGAAIGAAAVPVYTSLRTLSRVGLQFLMMINLPVMPEFTAEYARGNLGWISRIAGALVCFNAIAGLIGAIILATLGNTILSLWTHGAIQAPGPMLWLTGVAIVAATIWNPLSSLLVAANRHERFAIVLAAGVVITMPLTYAASRLAGLNGAAAAIMCLDLFLAGFALRQAQRNFGLRSHTQNVSGHR